MSKSLPSKHRRTAAAVILIALVLTLTTGVNRAQPKDLQAVWSRVAQAGSYRFEATVDQTHIPRADPGMVGPSSERVDWRLSGKVQEPEKLAPTGSGVASLRRVTALTSLSDDLDGDVDAPHVA